MTVLGALALALALATPILALLAARHFSSTAWPHPWNVSVGPSAAWCRSENRASPGWPRWPSADCRRTRSRSTWTGWSAYR